MTLLCLGESGLTLEPPLVRSTQALPLQAQTPVGEARSNVLFVNPGVRDETIANGSERAPFKTITQALRVAQPNTVIRLSTGTYSTSFGETFPLLLKPGVSIQGDPRTRGRNIIIQGGGIFISPTFARQNITILGANQARINGVSIINPNRRGYGLWIESSSPMVTNNTFTGNRHDGISITGESAPIIRSNYFYQNEANGITIYGTSRPEVRENVFEKTGFGINIAQNAAPVLIGNRITRNRAGIVVQANAKPVLRDNVIEWNTEDGVVAIATSQPNLGTKTEPGGNVFRRNGRYDINSSASSQVSAFGNQLALARITGSVDLAGTGSPVTTYANQPPSSQNPQTVSTNNEAKPVVLQPEPPELSQSTGEEPRATTTTTSIDIPVPPPASTAPEPSTHSLPQLSSTPNQNEDSNSAVGNTQMAPASMSDTAIEIPTSATASKPVAPPPAKIGGTAQKLPVLQPAPIVASELSAVPSSNMPIVNPPKLPQLAVPNSSASGDSHLPPTRTTLSLRYRVVVEAHSDSEQSRVRSLVPGAFRTFSNGRVLMQVGAFSDRAKADEIQRLLSSKGLKATIEQAK